MCERQQTVCCCAGAAVQSGVSDQPWGDHETLRGYAIFWTPCRVCQSSSLCSCVPCTAHLCMLGRRLCSNVSAVSDCDCAIAAFISWCHKRFWSAGYPLPVCWGHLPCLRIQVAVVVSNSQSLAGLTLSPSAVQCFESRHCTPAAN